MTISTTSTAALSAAEVETYRRDGFTLVPQVFSPAEVARYRDAAETYAQTHDVRNPGDHTFDQLVNVWRNDRALAELTLSSRLGDLAVQLSGIPMRIWHDQLLVKQPHNGAKTEFHQDAPYWPHEGSRHWLSAWVALVDVPVERGCMTFLPGQHHRGDIRAANLTDARDFFDAAPDLAWSPRVTLPLRAGDVTFHHGLTPHTANANDTDLARYAHVVAYMDAEARFSGRRHTVTVDEGLRPGAPFPDGPFPLMP